MPVQVLPSQHTAVPIENLVELGLVLECVPMRYERVLERIATGSGSSSSTTARIPSRALDEVYFMHLARRGHSR